MINENFTPILEAAEKSNLHPRVLEDGITHINIDQRGQTQIGRAVNHYAPTPFRHHQLGYFASIMAFWAFIRAAEPNDEMRYLVGPLDWLKAKRIETRKIENFHAILEDAYMQMFHQNEELGDWFADTKLPLDSYYIHTGPNPEKTGDTTTLVVHGRTNKWAIPMMERIRKRLQDDEKPEYVDCTELVNYINKKCK